MKRFMAECIVFFYGSILTTARRYAQSFGVPESMFKSAEALTAGMRRDDAGGRYLPQTLASSLVASKWLAEKTNATPIASRNFPNSLVRIMKFPHPLLSSWLIFASITLAGGPFSSPARAAESIKQPRIVGEWWQVAGDPDLGELTSEKQQPVDFGVWQAADKTWQLWSCIRSTKEPGKTRLFYHWEGARLTDKDWKPMGIAQHADTQTGELAGGLQAPYVFREGGRFVMFYGGWNDICSATSKDGKAFERVLNAEGKVTLFGAPTGNTRDPMVIRIGDLWHCYYTAHPERKGAVYCRTSPDLRTWSEEHLVAKGGQSGEGPSSSECPFVVELEPGQFYLFRNQIYGQKAKCSVYFSRDPFDFGIDHDEGHLVCVLPIAAPEIIAYEGQYYIAALLPSLKGIQIARLEWVATP